MTCWRSTGSRILGSSAFYIESGSASMQVDVPEDTARSIAYWILDHTNA